MTTRGACSCVGVHARVPTRTREDIEAFQIRWQALLERWFDRFLANQVTMQEQRRGRCGILPGANRRRSDRRSRSTSTLTTRSSNSSPTRSWHSTPSAAPRRDNEWPDSAQRQQARTDGTARRGSPTWWSPRRSALRSHKAEIFEAASLRAGLRRLPARTWATGWKLTPRRRRCGLEGRLAQPRSSPPSRRTSTHDPVAWPSWPRHRSLGKRLTIRRERLSVAVDGSPK